jgi:hypothetical protein
MQLFELSTGVSAHVLGLYESNKSPWCCVILGVSTCTNMSQHGADLCGTIRHLRSSISAVESVVCTIAQPLHPTTLGTVSPATPSLMVLKGELKSRDPYYIWENSYENSQQNLVKHRIPGEPGYHSTVSLMLLGIGITHNERYCLAT